MELLDVSDTMATKQQSIYLDGEHPLRQARYMLVFKMDLLLISAIFYYRQISLSLYRLLCACPNAFLVELFVPLICLVLYM
jgi:hypothetical protein